MGSVPTYYEEGEGDDLSEAFSPVIPFQARVIRDVVYGLDYSLGVHELLLSGSVGCLREDALVETISGKVPIGDITSRDYLATYHEKTNQFGLSLGSGAFPKGKGDLYRVINEHGEFVASGHHLVYTSNGSYSRIQDLLSQGQCYEAPHVLYETRHSSGQLLFASNVLRCWDITLNLINHCVMCIHQGGLRLPIELSVFLNDFPLQVDAQEYGLFFYSHKHERLGDLLGQELTRGHTSGQSFRLSMRDFFRLVEQQKMGAADAYAPVDSILYEHILRDSLTRLLCQTHSAHPQDLLFFLSKFCTLLSSSFIPPRVSITDSTYTIEKLGKQDWYFDMQVPNTNNYVANGAIHHNSAKSLLVSHMAVSHCLRHKKAHIGIGRQSMPNLKDTLFQMILDHIGESIPIKIDKTRGIIRFLETGSQITSVSWADKKYKKVRSYAFSAFIIEELTENEDAEAYKEIIRRIGRVPHIKENWLLMPTNPDSPSHWAYKKFISREKFVKNIHVYYSLTRDNPFLPVTYIDNLAETMTKQEADRMLRGLWVEIDRNRIYYNYSSDYNFLNKSYKIDTRFPIDIMHDFNIGEGKPMSAAVGQALGGQRHIFKEYHINGFRTLQLMEEMADSGLFEISATFRVFGDASGKNNDTRSTATDYSIIEKFLSTYVRSNGLSLHYEMHVPKKNPPLRRRQNLLNALCKNEKGKVNFFLYNKCSWIDEGLRLTAPVKGSGTIEDDKLEQQHVTTAIGYWVDYLQYRDPSKNKTDTKLL